MLQLLEVQQVVYISEAERENWEGKHAEWVNQRKKEKVIGEAIGIDNSL